MQAICSGGNETPRSAFPSLVQTTKPPDSAIAKLTPVIPAWLVQIVDAIHLRAARVRKRWVGISLGECRYVDGRSPPLLLCEYELRARQYGWGSRRAVARSILPSRCRPLRSPAILEIGIEMALLGQHRLAFNDPLDVVGNQDLMNDAIVLLGIACPVNDCTQASGVRSNCSI